MMYFLMSTAMQVIIFLAIVGAATLGVFAGIAMERKNAKEWLQLKDQRIEQLNRNVQIQEEATALYKTEVEFYKGLYISGAKPGATLNG